MAEEKERLKIAAVVGLAFSGLGNSRAVVLPLALFFVVIPFACLGAIKVFLLKSDPAGRILDLPAGLIAAVASIGVTATLDASWRGNSLSFVEALAVARKRYWPSLVTGFLAGLAIICGLVLLIVPGLILLAVWAVAQPVAILETWRGGSYALGRTRGLTRGFRWQIFLLWVLAVLAGGVLGGILGGIGGALGYVFGWPGLVEVVATPLAQGLAVVTGAALYAALYHEIVRIKEGGGRAVASVFD